MFRLFAFLSSVVLAAAPIWTAHAGEDATVPRFSTQKVYSTHAPDTQVPGRFHAGPCQGGPDAPDNKSARYEAGVDVYGNPVVAADLPDHLAPQGPGPSFQYLMPRAPSAIESKHGLIPDDYIVVDSGDGTVIYNNTPLTSSRDLPPAPGPCE